MSQGSDGGADQSHPLDVVQAGFEVGNPGFLHLGLTLNLDTEIGQIGHSLNDGLFLYHLPLSISRYNGCDRHDFLRQGYGEFLFDTVHLLQILLQLNIEQQHGHGLRRRAGLAGRQARLAVIVAMA